MLTRRRPRKSATFQLFQDQLEALQKIAGETGLSQAEILRQFVDRGIDEYEIDRVKRRGRTGRL